MTTLAADKTAQQIYDEIIAHIKRSKKPASSWYAGITQNPEQRVYIDHNVPRSGAGLIIRQASSANDARRVEEALLRQGCDGGTGGGDSDAVYVYAYLVTAKTVR